MIIVMSYRCLTAWLNNSKPLSCVLEKKSRAYVFADYIKWWDVHTVDVTVATSKLKRQTTNQTSVSILSEFIPAQHTQLHTSPQERLSVQPRLFESASLSDQPGSYTSVKHFLKSRSSCRATRGGSSPVRVYVCDCWSLVLENASATKRACGLSHVLKTWKNKPLVSGERNPPDINSL